MFVHIVDLGGLHDVTDDEELRSELCTCRDELVELTRTDECPIIRTELALHTLHDGDSSIGRDE